MKEKREEQPGKNFIFCPKTGKRKNLTKRERLFCFYYAESGRGKDAALRCGVGEELADRQAALWLQKPEIAERIRQIRKEQLQENIREFVIMTLKQMARSDPGEWIGSLIEKDGKSGQMQFLNVSEFKSRGDGQLELKFVDRLTVLEKLLELAQSDEPLKELYQELVKAPGGKPSDE